MQKNILLVLTMYIKCNTITIQGGGYMTKNKEKFLHVRVNEEILENFETICNNMGSNKSVEVRKMMIKFIEENKRYLD